MSKLCRVLTPAGLLIAMGTSADPAPRALHLPIQQCEPSALLHAHCPTHHPTCLWMADNEGNGLLFRVDLQEPMTPEVTTVVMQRVDGSSVETKDVEALAPLPGGRLLLLGSHSVKSDCGMPKKRDQFSVWSTLTRTSQEVRWNNGWRCATALSGVSSPYRDAFCQAVDAAAAKATAIAGSAASEARKKEHCREVSGLNFEGAVTHGSAVWLAARAPLVDGKAVLLRMPVEPASGLPAMRFDQLKLLDLGGRGVRELSADGAVLWIVAGPPADADTAFALFRMELKALDDAALDVASPTFQRTLPNGAEGLARVVAGLWIALDGDEMSAQCTEGKHRHLQLLDSTGPD